MKKYLAIILLLTLCFVFKTYGKQGNKTTKKSTKEDMILIVSGEFIMGSTEKKAKEGFELCKKYSDACQWDWFKVEMPQHQVFLDTYYIDKYEVTNAKYKECVNAGKCSKPKDTKYYDNSSYANHPVVNVDWEQADTYCKWVGKQLPTEAQWEKAARGTQGYTYPWGNNWDCKKSCNSVRPCKQNITCEVGSFSSDASSYGVMDMAGNVLEWVSDWYDGNYYENSPENNPTGASSGNYKVLRGGSWNYSNANGLRGAVRDSDNPDLNWISVGLRCVKSSK